MKTYRYLFEKPLFQHTIRTVYTHLTSVRSGSIAISPQYLNMQSKHSSARAAKSLGKRNNGIRIGVPCHLTNSAYERFDRPSDVSRPCERESTIWL